MLQNKPFQNLVAQDNHFIISDLLADWAQLGHSCSGFLVQLQLDDGWGWSWLKGRLDQMPRMVFSTCMSGTSVGMAGIVGGWLGLFPFNYVSRWLSWASSQHGGLKIVRHLTWWLAFPRVAILNLPPSTSMKYFLKGKGDRSSDKKHRFRRGWIWRQAIRTNLTIYSHLLPSFAFQNTHMCRKLASSSYPLLWNIDATFSVF